MNGMLKADIKVMWMWFNTEINFNAIFNDGLFSGTLDLGHTVVKRVNSDETYHYFKGSSEYRIKKELWSAFLNGRKGLVKNPTKKKRK